MNIPVDCESEAGKEYKARLEQLLTLGRSLPHIISEKVNHIKVFHIIFSNKDYTK